MNISNQNFYSILASSKCYGGEPDICRGGRTQHCQMPLRPQHRVDLFCSIPKNNGVIALVWELICLLGALLIGKYESFLSCDLNTR